jgi:stage V sporulation protein D (sporulation-specific penicillin-binding protein)
MRSELKLRLRILSGVFVCIALLLALRLYFVQIVHGDEYRESALGQYVSAEPDTGERGSILFTTKDGAQVAAAVMQTGWRLAINPKLVSDSDATYAALNSIVSIDRERFFASAAKKSDPYEEVGFRISDKDASAIREKALPGLILARDQWRFYPARELAANTVGFVGYKDDVKTGVYGLEKQYNLTLAIHTSGTAMNPFAELFANAQALLSLNPASHEGSIITSIEPNVERQLENTLDAVVRTYTPRLAGGIVMDPVTGEILAMATRPTFDPNTYNTVDDPAAFSNPLVEGRYELGSIMKPLTVAAGIDSGAITEKSTYNDTGCINVSTYKVCNFDGKARGVVPMQEVLSQSLNLGVSYVATTMGFPTFTRYMQAYGFDSKTGIDLPNEVQGDLSPLGKGSGPAVNYDTASFGQGISVSPVEMIRALSGLANGGTLPNPHVVTGIKFEDGITRSIALSRGDQVLQPASARAVTNMLVEVYDKALLKGELKQDHYSIAAKTGTAQIPKPGGGYHGDNRYLHSFFGYFPAHDPKFIVFLFAIEPHGQEYASATLARPFDEIARYLINYYQLPPDR